VLTAREMEVLQLLARGCTYADTAHHLGISVHTVSTHVRNTYRKLSVHSAPAAVARFASRASAWSMVVFPAPETPVIRPGAKNGS